MAASENSRLRNALQVAISTVPNICAARVIGGVANHLRHRRQHRTENDAGDMAHAAEHHHREGSSPIPEGRTIRGLKTPYRRGEQAACEAAGQRAEGERGGSFDVAGVDAHGLAAISSFRAGPPGRARANAAGDMTPMIDRIKQQGIRSVELQTSNLHAKTIQGPA